MNSFINNLDWRFATKAFDTTKKVSEADMATVKHAIRMTPTSFGLQPFKVIHVTDSAIRVELKVAAYGQAQVTDSSELLVFCSRLDILDCISEYALEAKKQTDYDEAGIARFVASTTDFANGMSAIETEFWSANQAYIALGFALAACCELKIDSCPMGGFDKEKFDEILKLPPELKSQAILTIGYKAHEPKHQKIRLSETSIFDFK